MAPTDTELMRKAVALAPAAVLRKLADALPLEEHADDLPVVTVQLSGGHSVTGGLVAVDNDRDQEVAVLTTAYELRNPVDHLVYFLVRDVIAVAVHTPGRVRDVLSAGALPSPDSGEPVIPLVSAAGAEKHGGAPPRRS